MVEEYGWFEEEVGFPEAGCIYAATALQRAYLLLHPAPTCAVQLAPTLYLHSQWSGPHCMLINAGACMPGLRDLQQLALVRFLPSKISANTLLALGVVTLSNLHCVVVV